MIFTDGECPLCRDHMLKLNLDDLLECPNCHLQLAVFDPIAATVIPELGDGEFRENQSALPKLNGVALAESVDGTVLSRMDAIFDGRETLKAYLEREMKKGPKNDR